MFSKFFGVLQKVGQSLMIPVSVLPAAGLLVAFGRLLKDSSAENSTLVFVGNIMYAGGLAIFEQLPLIFAIGVAIGFAGQAGIAGLSAAVGYFTMTNILKVYSETQGLALPINTGVFGGILIGIVAANLYNRFHKIQLYPIFGFFSGRRFVPIVTAFAAFGLAMILTLVWPPIQTGIHDFGLSVLNSQWGPAFYAAGKRLLIPVGLHHVYYPSFLYEFGDFVTNAGTIVRGDATRYYAGDPTAGIFMASEFPLMLFGLPAAAFAMYLAAPLNKRKAVGGIMLSAALTSILTGITEPIEFAFIFVAPLLYALHVALAFGSGLLTHYFDIHLGYTFSASLIDLGVGFFNQKNSFALLIIGPFIGLVYFATFYSLIKLFNFKTPGRESDLDAQTVTTLAEETPYSTRAVEILMAIGGRANVESLDACITRLRLVVKDSNLIQKNKLKTLGAAGVMQNGQNIQIVFGVESDKIKDEIQSLMTKAIFVSPLKGRILNLDVVPDATFSQKVLGDGFAILPEEGIVYSPFDGKVVSLFPTNHAIGIETTDGIELLIHIGIDTVQMKGEGFKAFVKSGDTIRAGDKLIEFDLELVRQKAKSVLTPVIITNMDQFKELSIQMNQSVSSLAPIGELQLNHSGVL